MRLAFRVAGHIRHLASLQHIDNSFYTVIDAAVVVPGLKASSHDVADYIAGQTIGESPFKPIAHFDAQAPVFWRDENQNAVILSFLAQLPFFKNCDGVSLDALA